MPAMIIESRQPNPSSAHLVREYYYFSSGTLPQSRMVPVIDDGCYDFIFFKERDSVLLSGPDKQRHPIPFKVFTIHQLKPPYRIRFGESLTFFTIKVQPWANAHFFSFLEGPGVFDLLAVQPELERFHMKVFETENLSDTFDLADGLVSMTEQLLSPSAQWVKQICEAIYRERGMTSVNTLSEIFGKSRQYLNRIFKQEVLYSLKQFILTVRIMDLVKYRMANPEISLTDLCYEYDYFDQPHFNRDFRRICGVTPTQFFGNLPDFLLRH
jgi:AraC-like DNA-binding protein